MRALLIFGLGALAAGCNDKDPAGGTGLSETGPAGSDDTDDTTPPQETDLPPEGCLGDPPELGPDTCVSAAPCAWGGDGSYAYFGYALDAGGDFDGDGLADIVVGAPGADSESANAAGQITLISGAATASGDGIAEVIYGDTDYLSLGYDVAFVGDVDGDGLDDVMAGGRGSDATATGAGEAWLILGEDPDGPSEALFGETEYARVGTALAGAGDLDGDGLAEVLVAGDLREFPEEDSSESFAAGRAYLLYGDAAGWSGGLADAASWAGDTSTDGALGLALGGGDLDGDGYSDAIAAAPYSASYTGRVYLLPGGASRYAGDGEISDAPVQLDGAASYDAFGWALAAGDVTGDGVDDLIVGAPLHDSPWNSAGALYVYAGGAGALESGPEQLGWWTGSWDDHSFGDGIAAGQDVDGDGIGDLISGSVHARSGLKTRAGKSYVLPGRADGWPQGDDVGSAPIVFHGADVKDYLGRAAGLGDVTGDGRADVVVAAGYANLGGGYDMGQIYLFPSL